MSKDNKKMKIKVILEIDLENENFYREADLSFELDSTIGEITKKIVNHFNNDFDEKNEPYYLDPNSNDYQLCDYEGYKKMKKSIRSRYKHDTILASNRKIRDIPCQTYRLIYSPEDITLNYKRGNGCRACYIM